MSERLAPVPTTRSRHTEPGVIGAFLRRDLRVMQSYPAAIVGDAASMAVQLTLFAFVSRMVEPSAMPDVGGRVPTYLEFVTVGIAVAALLQTGMGRVVATVRREQLTGTLEYLLMTPTSVPTLLVGSVAFDALYVTVRTSVLLTAAALVFDLRFAATGVGPTIVLLGLLVIMVWGIGIALAAAVLTFRGGGSGAGLAGLLVGALSGAYFPLSLLPDWLHWLASRNPVAVGMDAVRSSLLGGTGWSASLPAVIVLAVAGTVTVTVGLKTFRMALARELRRGSIGLY